MKKGLSSRRKRRAAEAIRRLTPLEHANLILLID
jgi:hypothetical protein